MEGKRLFRSIVISGCLLGHFLPARADGSFEEFVSDGASKLREDLLVYKEECQRFIRGLNIGYLEGHVHTGEDSNQVVLGDTLLCHVARHGRFREAKFLLEKGADPDATGFDLLDEDIVMRILSEYDVHSNTPLCEAVRKGHYEIVELLLQHGADPNKENNSSTPLEQAAYFYCQKDKEIGLELMKLLLENGADPNQGGHCHPSVVACPLHIISAYGDDPEAIPVLVNAGADIKKERANGNTPLHDAAEQGNYKLIEVLIEEDVVINALNESHQTPLDLLIIRRNQLKRAGNRWLCGRNSSMEFGMKEKYEKSLELLRKHGATIGSAIETEDSEVHRFLRAQ
jgi:hypothetical protein